MTDADYVSRLAYAPAQAWSLLHILEQTAKSISLNMNANKTEFMCF